ncbi:MAG: flagellar assembly protein FliX [Rhodospirillaceae bacterium]|nr:flagellar assembly protein FliX [Rhodospirillaceae bacterium]
MKVEGSKSTGSVQGAGGAKKAGPVGKAGAFAEELDRVSGADEAAAPEAVAQVGTVLGVGGILAAQSADPEGAPDHKERQRRAQRGVDLLDGLEVLRRGLLAGAIPKDRLQDLAHMVREKRERGADPVISRLLDEIELRAEVELAKLSRRIP